MNCKRIGLSLVTCLMAGVLAHAQQVKPQAGANVQKELSSLNKTNADSIFHQQGQAVKEFKTGKRSEGQKYGALPRLSAVKRKPSSGSAWNQWPAPVVSVDTLRIKGIKNSWMNKDREFTTDGNNSTYPDLNVGSLSEFKDVVSASSLPVRPDKDAAGLPKGLQDLSPKSAGPLPVPSLEQQTQSSLQGLEKQQSTLKTQADNTVDGLQGNDLFAQARDQVTGAKKIYSKKQLAHLRDSLGGPKFDSLFQLASTLTKKEISKDDFLGALGQPLPGKSPLDHINMDQQSIDAPGVGALDNVPATMSDLSQVKLPQSALSELPPLTGNEVSGKYLKVVDSLRDLNLKKERITLEEKKITEDAKATIVKKKPSFLDKTYFEGIVGFLKEGDLTLLQASPSFGYHFTDNLSIGAGPSILLRSENKSWSTSFGFRSFLKAEFFGRKAYLQLEDDVKPGRINAEKTFSTPHSILFGGGALIALSGKMALNPSLLYRLNNDQSTVATSPWVFRLGISTIKLK